MSRLILIEAEKLLKSAVFWVAPIVIIFFLGVMLFGFEVYAAKNGVEITETNRQGLIESEKYSPSLIANIFSGIGEMVKNVFFLSTTPTLSFHVKDGSNALEAPVEQKMNDFNYLGTLIDSLLNPKPLPRPIEDCPCKEENPARESTLNISLFSFSLATAHATDLMDIKGEVPLGGDDLFVERVKKRMLWLMEPVELKRRMVDRERFNGMRYTYLSLYFSVVFIFPLITIVVTAQMFTEEFSHATIRTALLRSVEKWQIILSKVIVLTAYLFGTVFFFIFLTLIVGCSFAGFGNLNIDSQIVGNIGNPRIILSEGALMLFFLSVPVCTISLLPVAAFSVLITYMKPEPATVVGISSITYLILFTLGGLSIFQDIRFLFFTSYMDAWVLMFQSPFSLGEFSYKIVALLLISAAALLLANYLSDRKDIFV